MGYGLVLPSRRGSSIWGGLARRRDRETGSRKETWLPCEDDGDSRSTRKGIQVIIMDSESKETWLSQLLP